MKDPYAVLGIPRTASRDDIKKAYRKLAKELHPDVNPGNKAVEQRFKEVSAAYNLLSDQDKRAKFDRGEINADGTPRYDSVFHQAYSGGGRGGPDFEFGGADFEDLFSDLFSRVRGGARATRAQARGRDVQYTVQATFEEAAKGGRRRVNLFDGKSVELTIPPGTEDGQTLRLRGQGMAGPGGPAGDALVTIRVPRHRHFRREGRDIHVTIPVSLDEAVLGCKLRVPTIDGYVTVSVPPGSNTGTRLRLKGKGIPARTGGDRGNQYVHIEVILPEQPDEELKSFLREWSGRHAYNVRKKAGFE